MSRAAIRQTIISGVVVIAALGLGSWAYVAHSPSHIVTITTNAQHQTTQLSYRGVNGQTALALLEKHAGVQTKHYSFGDMVTAIDGTPGTGPRYWMFYVNGKEASVGAGSYTTRDTDTVTWKLQP